MHFLVNPGTPIVQKKLCYFCDKAANKEDGQRHLVSSFLDERVPNCAEILGKRFLQAKFLNRDINCTRYDVPSELFDILHKKTNTAQLVWNYCDSIRKLHGIAFSKVVTYVDEITVVFKLSDLNKLYCHLLKELGIDV